MMEVGKERGISLVSRLCWEVYMRSNDQAADNGVYFFNIFNFSLTFTLIVDWMMFERCLNRDWWKSINKPVALTSTGDAKGAKN